MPGARRPPSHTALAALPAIALDLETTGLDVVNDRIVQIGAVALRGPVVLSTPRMDARVDPGIPIPAASTRIHGITDAGVAGAPRFPELVESLVETLAGRVVIGQNIRFDLAVLRHEAARAGVPWRDPPVLDVAHLAGALDRGLVDLGLESLANRFGVTIEARHDALGDSLAAAGIFTALVPRLRDADVRTLGEAEAFAARRTDLIRREVEAGWYSMPGEAPDAGSLPPLARVDSFLYLRRLDDVMNSPAQSIRPQGTLREAARIMIEQGIGALLVIGGEPRPAGIVTERDLLRATTDLRIDIDVTPVSSVMSMPVQTMSGDEMIYRALGRMDRLGVRHLCVADASGAALGMVSQRDLLHHRASAAAELGDAVACADDAAALAAAHSRLPDVVAGLVAEGLTGDAAARIVSNEIRALTARAVAIAVERLESEGYGPAPAPWCVLVLGSGGRGESLLSADQDNALVHAGSEEDDGWFAALDPRAHPGRKCGGARVTDRRHDARPDPSITTDLDPRSAARGSRRRRAPERRYRGTAALTLRAASARSRSAYARRHPQRAAFFDRAVRYSEFWRLGVASPLPARIARQSSTADVGPPERTAHTPSRRSAYCPARLRLAVRTTLPSQASRSPRQDRQQATRSERPAPTRSRFRRR